MTRTLSRRTMWSLSLVLATAALMTPGCQSEFIEVTTLDAFESHVRQSEQPTVVEFYKNGCPACFFLEGTMTTLSNEYKDHVTFLKVERTKGAEVRYTHAIHAYPTVLLFVDGVERANWRNEGNIDIYRAAIDAALEEMAARTTPETSASP